MDILNIARKLEPLIPDQIEKWLRIREGADAELKALLDRQLFSIAYKFLGNFHNKIFLSLPPKLKARGEISLGTVVYEQEKWPFGISSSELMQHMGIFGRSGAGKTNVAFQILLQLAEKKIPWLFVDWKRTARALIPKLKGKVSIYTPGRRLSPFPFNPFIAPPGLEENIYFNHVIDILSDAYTLGDGARSILRKALDSCYNQANTSPSLTDVLQALEKLPGKGRAGGWKISATRALESVSFAEVTTRQRVSQEEMVRMLLNQNTILELDGLDQGSKKFLVPLLALWIFYVKLASSEREKLKLVLFLEEAHLSLPKTRSGPNARPMTKIAGPRAGEPECRIPL